MPLLRGRGKILPTCCREIVKYFETASGIQVCRIMTQVSKMQSYPSFDNLFLGQEKSSWVFLLLVRCHKWPFQIRQSGIQNRTAVLVSSEKLFWLDVVWFIFMYSLMLSSHERWIYFWQVKISFETLQYRSLLYPVGPWTLGVQIRGYWSLLICSVTPEREKLNCSSY